MELTTKTSQRGGGKRQEVFEREVKPEEVMIGDWVMVERNCEKGIYYAVKTDAYLLLELTRINSGTSCYSKSFSLRLSSRFLLLNGWEHIANGWRFKDIRLTENFELFIYKHHVKMQSVDQLQRALRICGYADEANNFKLTEGGKQ